MENISFLKLSMYVKDDVIKVCLVTMQRVFALPLSFINQLNWLQLNFNIQTCKEITPWSE